MIVVYYFKLGHICSKQSPKYKSTIKLLPFLFYILFTGNSLPVISQLQSTVQKLMKMFCLTSNIISWMSLLFSMMKCNILYTKWKEILLFIRNCDWIFIEKHSACYI